MAADSLFLPDEAATTRLGARLAAKLKPGDVVRLEGDLGAGKTSLARAIIRALMDDPELDVPSPSFALVQPYEGKGTPILHADFYRLGSAMEAEELGVFDTPGAIVLIEWAERAESLLPRKVLTVRLSVPADGKGRLAEIER